MDDLKVQREESRSQGRYVIRLGDDVSDAEMSFSRPSGRLMVIHRTWVPQAYRGRQIAEKLVQAAITDARKEGFEIDSQCSYVDRQFERHPDWQDLLAT